MEDILSETRQLLLNAQELLDARFYEAPTGQNRRASEIISQLIDEISLKLLCLSWLNFLGLGLFGSRPLRAPPASKQVVANLPTMIVTEETLINENLVINDKMQELPCKHLFYPLCLIPWLDKHNSCPVCRHELTTDNQAYECWKESEKEAEKTRRDAANSVCGDSINFR
ncbi:hypothetical protein MKX03_028375 [Papaver bracteatum]|nr:hypothetical protein MKX03_028375 [Papaver bracteatum]